MKRISFFLLILLGLFAFVSCDKSKNNDPDNHFSYAGKNYVVDSAGIVEVVLGSGTADEISIFQLAFSSVTGTDTAYLLLAVYDTLSNTLSGNYPGVDQMDAENNSRGILPFGFFIASAISLPNGNSFFTGDGGSVDISVSNNQYTIKINDLSVGDYADILDTNEDGKAGYTETGKIGGLYKGNIIKYTQVLSKKNTSQNPLINRIMQNRVLDFRK